MKLQASRVYVNIPKEGLKELGSSCHWIPEAIYIFENHAYADAEDGERTVTLAEALIMMCEDSSGGL